MVRYLIIAVLVAATASASIVTADRISVDVPTPPQRMLYDVGVYAYGMTVTVNARLTNTGSERLFLNGIGGGMFGFTHQIQPNAYIAAGESIEGPMFSVLLWDRSPAPWTDDDIIWGVSESAYGIYSVATTFHEYDWLIPPTWDSSQWTVPPVQINRLFADIPVTAVPTPEPATVGMTALAFSALAIARRRSPVKR